MKKGKILIIDDEERLRGLLARLLELEDFTVYQASSASRGYEILKANDTIQVVVTDVRLPDESGLEVLKKVHTLYPETEVVVITAFGTIHDGVEAIKRGAFDYLTKDDQNDQMVVTVVRAAEKAAMKERIHDLERTLALRHGFETIIGKSDTLQQCIRLAQKVASTDTTILIQGETGTGKELFAQAIHYTGSRKDKTFITLNCSNFPGELLESELFGYRKGAFTGAVNDKKGLMEAAREGTVFLDEIGDIGLPLQAKLLRVLESHSFMKLGDTRETQIDVRVIAASNRNLREASENGQFRPDLFHRLSVFTIELPPLRERKGDIEILCTYFLNQFATMFKKSILGCDKECIELLNRYPWKGNVRELRNILERAAILCDNGWITASLLPPEFRYSSEAAKKQGFGLDEIEKAHILKVLEITGHNKAEAARLLNIGLATLYRKLEEYGVLKK